MTRINDMGEFSEIKKARKLRHRLLNFDGVKSIGGSRRRRMRAPRLKINCRNHQRRSCQNASLPQLKSPDP